jgi:competence protein ComEC
MYHRFSNIYGDGLSGRQWAIILTGITFFVLSADIFYWIGKRWGKTDLSISIMDVGQGNAALIEMPGGQCALIDGGGYSNNEIFDVGEKVIAPFLWQKKIKTIETVILTHYDSDHINGLIFILKHFNVQQVFANHDPATCFKNKGFNDIISNKQIDYPPYNRFPKKININGVTLKILYPLDHFAELAVNDSWRDSNNNSMVIQINFENKTILFPGDIMQKAEEELIGLKDDIQSTIMVAPHHGSDSSSSPIFIKQVNPEYIIISAGKQNRFGFPEVDVLQQYEKNQIITYRTDVSGGVYISISKDGLTIVPFD